MCFKGKQLRIPWLFKVCRGLYYPVGDHFINHYKDPYETIFFRGSGVLEKPQSKPDCYTVI